MFEDAANALVWIVRGVLVTGIGWGVSTLGGFLARPV